MSFYNRGDEGRESESERRIRKKRGVEARGGKKERFCIIPKNKSECTFMCTRKIRKFAKQVSTVHKLRE